MNFTTLHTFFRPGRQYGRIISLCVLLAAGLSPTLSQENTKPTPKKITITFSWRPVSRALAYKLEIKNGKDTVVYADRLTRNRLTLKLSPGKYYRRIASINKFNKVAAWSDWIEFEVKPPKNTEPAREWDVIRHDFDDTTIITRQNSEATGSNKQKQGGVLTMEWSEAGRAAAYRVEIKDKNGRLILRKTLRGTGIKISLVPGKYKRRVVALNKFMKPGAATPWEAFRVRRRKESKNISAANAHKATRKYRQAKQENTDRETRKKNIAGLIEKTWSGFEREETRLARLEKKETRKDTGKAKEKEKELKKKTRPSPEKKELKNTPISWKLAIPGLPQFERGERNKGLGFGGLFLGATFFGLYSWNRADTLASRSANDFLFQAYNEPLLFLSLRDTLFSSPVTLLLATQGYGANQADQVRYARHQRNQSIAGGLALIVYAAHIYDALFNVPAPSGKSGRLGQPKGELYIRQGHYRQFVSSTVRSEGFTELGVRFRF